MYVRFVDISGRPILSQVADRFWNILEKKEDGKPTEKSKRKIKYKEQVVYLHLLRSYRELAEWEKYDTCHEKIEDVFLDYDNKQFLYASDCWQQLFRFQAEKLAGMLNSWNLAKGDVYWPIVKASMNALIGETSKADTILVDTLTLVRSILKPELFDNNVTSAVMICSNNIISSLDEKIKNSGFKGSSRRKKLKKFAAMA